MVCERIWDNSGCNNSRVSTCKTISDLEHQFSIGTLTHDKPVLDSTPAVVVGRIGKLTPETAHRRFTPDVDNRLDIAVAVQATNKVEHGFVFAGFIALAIDLEGGSEMGVSIDDGRRRRWLRQPQPNFPHCLLGHRSWYSGNL